MRRAVSFSGCMYARVLARSSAAPASRARNASTNRASSRGGWEPERLSCASSHGAVASGPRPTAVAVRIRKPDARSVAMAVSEA